MGMAKDCAIVRPIFELWSGLAIKSRSGRLKAGRRTSLRRDDLSRPFETCYPFSQKGKYRRARSMARCADEASTSFIFRINNIMKRACRRSRSSLGIYSIATSPNFSPVTMRSGGTSFTAEAASALGLS